jgi:HAD superfamily hydrolase (TIGR01509 family)
LLDYEAFIFDMDGVLVDSENFYKEIEQQLFRQLGLEISHEEHIDYQGASNISMWTMIKEKHPNLKMSINDLATATDEKVKHFFNSCEFIEPMPGAEGLLIFLLEKNIKLALASSSTLEIIEVILRKTGLKRYFSVVVDSEMAGAGKPNPAIFLMAAQKLGVQPENCVVIEDSFNGIAAALNAGMFCIAYNGPGSEHQDQSAAHLRIKDFSELTIQSA